MMEETLPSLLLMIFRQRLLTVSVLLLYIEMLITVSSLRAVGFWSYTATDDFDTFQQIAVDTKTGNVFAASKNSVFKFNGLLKLVTQLKTGPVLDDLRCHPNDVDCRRENMMDNNAKLLKIDPSLNHLLFCGSIQQGLCSVISINNLTLRKFDAANPANFVGGEETVYAFYGSNFQNSFSLFVARTYDGRRPLHFSTKAISVLSSHEIPDSSIWLQSAASLDFDLSAKSQYIVRYIYGFVHGGYVYFVTVQRESLVEEYSFETRLVRFCQNDTNFYSYTEVTLTCRQRNSVATFLNVAQAASFAPVGKDFSKRFGLPEDEVALYVLMARSGEKSWEPNASYGSGLCLYTLTDIRKAFTKAQQDCYRGYGRLLPWITYMEPRCSSNPTIAAKMDDDFCGLPLNVGIGSRYPLSTNTNFTTNSYLGTSLAVIFHQGKTIVIMGTSNGSLMKVLFDGMNSRAYQVLNLGVGLTKRFPVAAADMVFDPTQDHLYALTGPRITRVPLRSCIVYSDCSSCVSSGDPLGCGWCEDHCSTGDQCMSSWSKDICSPVIQSFHPQCGPVSGGTSVTIVGQNFGNGSQSTEAVSASIKVAMVDCTIEHHNNTCIVCLTGQSLHGPTAREVKVTIIDLSRTTVNFDIRGSVSTLHNSFAYKVPTLESVVPLIGPKAGGTQLTIMGLNLDIGSSRSVMAANHPCNVIRVTTTSLVCKTSAFSSHNSTHFLSSWLSLIVDHGPVNVSIDGVVLNVNNSIFAYVDDPVVTNVFPRVSFLSGGIPITVTGSNLHVTQLPTLLVQKTSDAHHFSSNCYSNQNGSMMNCQSPNITDSDKVYPLDRPLVTKLCFDMDGLKTLILLDETNPQLSHFEYFVDPVLEQFPGHGHIRLFYDDENYLDLQGRFLNLAAAETDYRVTIGGTDCCITQLTSTMLLCRPKKPEMMSQIEPYKAVQVHVGNLVFPIGSLQYARRHENVMAMITVVPVVSIVCLLCFVVLIIWACKTCTGHAKAKDPVSFIHVSDARVSRIPIDLGLEHLEYRQLDLPIFDAEAWNILVESNMFIAKNELILLDIIGQGHFGCVYRGLMCSEADKEEVEVAVKTLKPLLDDTSLSSLEARKFLDEALRMREFDHEHVLGLIGISLDQEDMPLVVLPFMEHGDLLSYLRCEDNSPKVKDLMEFCIQIADGMTYLASLKFVHRDLAARNCMLDDGMRVKVADFGLSRDIYERDYYSSDNRKTKLPVKWMALESLEKGIYNTKTDVWSYGVVLWEMMTRGVCPYPEVDNWDVIKFLRSGRRLPQPSYCPDPLYQTMLSCWHPVASFRPSFDTLMTVVTDVIAALESMSEHVGLNVTYVNVPEAVDYLVANADFDLDYGCRTVTLSSHMTAV